MVIEYKERKTNEERLLRKLYCTYCKGVSHTFDRCYKKNHDLKYQSKNNNKNNDYSEILLPPEFYCGYCNTRTHKEASCFKNKSLYICVVCKYGKHTSKNCTIYQNICALNVPCQFCSDNMGFTVYHPLLICHNRIELSKN